MSSQQSMCVILEIDNDIIKAGFTGEMTPRIALKVKLIDIDETSVLSILNTIFMDLLQFKMKVYFLNITFINFYLNNRTLELHTNCYYLYIYCLSIEL